MRKFKTNCPNVREGSPVAKQNIMLFFSHQTHQHSDRYIVEYTRGNRNNILSHALIYFVLNAANNGNHFRRLIL